MQDSQSTKSQKPSILPGIIFWVVALVVNEMGLRLALNLIVTLFFPESALVGEGGFAADLHGTFTLPLRWLDVFLASMGGWIILTRDEIRQSPIFKLTFWIGIFVVSGVFYLAANQYFGGRFKVFRIIWLVWMAWCLLRGWYLGILEPHRSKKWVNLVAFTLFGSLVLVLLLEIGFMFMARSHKNNQTLASQVWFARYWDLNERGYRQESQNKLISKPGKKLLLLGDSFTSGHGIKNPEDRWGNVLQQNLSQSTVINWGMNGSDTRNERNRLNDVDFETDLLILAWFANDLHEAAATSWKSWPEYAGFQTDGPVRHGRPVSLTRGSYFVNWFYTSAPKRADAWSGKYLDFQREAFSNPAVLKTHYEDLDEILQWANAHDTKLVFVAFPFMENVDDSRFALDPALEWAASREVPALDLSDAVKTVPEANRMVNPTDPHPSVEVQHAVGHAIAEWLKKEELLP